MGWQGSTLLLRYHAETDKDTILNLTNHTHFNLDGMGTIDSQLLTIRASQYTVTGADGLPTGEIADVADTAMDFRTEHSIGKFSDSSEKCVSLFHGYDANYILDGSPAAVARSEKTGIRLIVATDQPGVQFYTANDFGERIGKGGAIYGHRCGFCLETQHYPDCIHHPEWPSCILRAGEVFDSFTAFTFEVDR